MRTRLEQYFLDNRAYPGCVRGDYATRGSAAGETIYKPASVKNFADHLPALTATTLHRHSALASASRFTVDQTNARKTTAVPAGWTTSTVCWVSRKNGDC